MREVISRCDGFSTRPATPISAGIDPVVPACPEPQRLWPLYRYLLLLIVLITAMRIWQVCHTEVTSRDTLTYIRMAWQLENADWRVVLREASHHPAYPVSVLLASWVVRPLVGNDLVIAMPLGAQLASALASILLVFPMFLLGLELFDRRISFWATLLFQCLPACGRVLGDGLSEGLFLFWAACSLYFATRSLQTGSPWGFALCGLTSALAYLTRPEGIALVAATGLVLLGLQILPRCRSRWRPFLLRGASLLLPALLLVLPYMFVIGRVAAKHGAEYVIGVTSLHQPIRDTAAPPPSPSFTTLPLAVWWVGGDRDGRWLWSVVTPFGMLVRAFFWILWIPALVGLWNRRDRMLRVPGAWVMGVLFVMVMPILFRITVLMGYLSDRHMLLIVLCLSYWTIVGIDRMGRGLAVLLAPLRPALRFHRWTTAPACSLLLLLALTVVPAYKSLEKLHSNRLGFREAGRWLAQNIPAKDRIVDPFGWASYYSGRIFSEPLPGNHPPPTLAHYVILEQTDNKHPHLVGWPDAVEMVKVGHSLEVHDWVIPRGKLILYQVFLPPNWSWQPR
jgi:Dolichyl-phosphate-mannose-protein mannosyltransferase